MRDLQGSQMEKVNQPITVAAKRLQAPEGMLLQIELYVASVAVLLLFIAAFGSLRRQNKNPMLNTALWAAYNLSGYLITYTLGLMRESPFRNPLFPLWATFLMIFLGSSNTFSTYSLDDNEQWLNDAWKHLVTFIGLLILWTLYLTTLPLTMAVFVLYIVLLVLKATERSLSLMSMSERSRQRIAKWVADHMRSKHHDLKPCEVNPTTMKGYRYVVRVNRTLLEKILGEVAAPKPNPERDSKNDDKQIITIEQVWACRGWLLSPDGEDRDGKLKDICLSYALYLLLRLKYWHYLLPEEDRQKAGRLIREGILGKEDGPERAFRVAEVELAFLHDFFYTHYPIIFQARLWLLKVMELLCLIMGTTLTVVFLIPKTTKPQDPSVRLVTSNGWSVDVLVTAVVLMVFLCVELVQLFLMAVSDWAKVKMLCTYVEKEPWHNSKCKGKLIGLLCRLHMKTWERKLRQYSFLESYNYGTSRILYNFCRINFFDVTRSGKKQGTPVRLSDNVKKAAFQSMRNINGNLENGQASLRLNNVWDELSWACRGETQTEVIMVWHIATSFLEHKAKSSVTDFGVATHLSKYLAYLVAFAPRLLPDHPYDAENKFDQVIRQARSLLDGYETAERRIDRLSEIADTPDDTVVNWGARLGVQLLKEEPRRIWKILADFWAELILYVSSSDDAKPHVEHLATGGEFVSLLWALVSHAGINREPPGKP